MSWKINCCASREWDSVRLWKSELFGQERTPGRHAFKVLSGRCQSEKVPESDARPAASWERQGYGITWRISVVAGNWRGRGFMKHRGFFGLWNCCVWCHSGGHLTTTKAQRLYNTLSPDVAPRLWSVIICPCSPIKGKDWAALVGTLAGTSYAGVTWDVLVPSHGPWTGCGGVHW